MKLRYLLLLLAHVGCLHVDRLEYKPIKIGDSVQPGNPNDYLMISASWIAPTTKILNPDGTFTVAYDDSKRIVFISTDSANFHTAEGLGIKSTLEDVLKAGGSPVRYETGWAHYSVLPSGWCAAFQQASYDGNRVQLLQAPGPNSKVAFFFKRQGLAT